MTGFRIDDLALEVLKRAVHKTVQHALYFYRILFLNLSIISICSVFSVVMLILKFLWCRSYLQIYQFAAACHLCHFFQNNCIMNSFMCIFSPCKWSVIFAQYCRNSFIIAVFEMFCDQHARIFFVCLFNLIFCQITYARNLSIDIVCMSRSIARNGSSCLCPACCPLRMCMYDSPDIWKFILQNHMCRGIRRRIVFTLYFISLKIHNNHIFRS